MEKIEMLEKLNKFTRKTLTENEVYIFDVILCDNDIDRDGERFSMNALKSLEKLLVGKTGIFDHNPSSACQNARIFHTELVTDNSKTTLNNEKYTYLKGTAYMVRTDENVSLIKEIEGGIKKEVSVSCNAGKRSCSICGTDLNDKTCPHTAGKNYNGKIAHAVLDNITDAYEWSFVAVPAQVNAGVTKKYRNAESINTENTELIEMLCKNLKSDIYRLCMASGSQICTKALTDAAEKMSAMELIEFKKTLEKEHRPTLVSQLEMRENNLNEFRMEGGYR